MTERLKISIEQLYETFAKYQGLSKLEGSTLYDNLDNWNKALRSKKLRELTDEDLSRFAGKVILTWGDADDYRCYLPRILELTAELNTPYDVWTLYSRLEDASWKTWEIKEQIAINDFTLKLWHNLLNDNSDKAEREFKDYFHAFSTFYPDFLQLLEVWETQVSFAATKHLTNYIFEERIHVFEKNYIDSIKKNTNHVEFFKTWLTSDKIITKIEKAFFDNENKEMEERISWVEQILTNEKKGTKL